MRLTLEDDLILMIPPEQTIRLECIAHSIACFPPGCCGGMIDLAKQIEAFVVGEVKVVEAKPSKPVIQLVPKGTE